MLVSSKELYKAARERNFAFPAANFVDQLSASAYVEMAEKRDLPLILSFAQVHQQYLSFDEAISIGLYYAGKARVPVVLHLDHGTDQNFIFKAIDSGFSSVMIDASSESLEENIRRTKEIVRYAHLCGVVVEAEIGHVGEGAQYCGRDSSNNIYTSVDEAKTFAAQTEVDSLAISIGTAHGAYKGTPAIDFQRLEEIRGAIDTPLVLHGGSSSGDENLHRCATGGISKINIYTDFILGAFQTMRERNCEDYFAVRQAMKDGMMACLDHYYTVFDTQKYKA